MDTHIHFIEKDYVLDAVISYDTFKELKKKFDYLDFVGIYNNEIVMLCSQYHTILMGVKWFAAGQGVYTDCCWNI